MTETLTPTNHKARTQPRTGLKLGVGVAVFATALAIAFVLAHHRRAAEVASLAYETESAAAAPLAVDVVRVQMAPKTEPLTLPGETRAWYQTTLYARVNGYVEKWLVDIGDRVKKGQVLATIETPDLDDQLTAAQAKLKASEAQVKVAQANADFAKSTYTRWWESPQGVVSDQEKQEKKQEYDGSAAQLDAARAQVNLDKADVERLSTLAQFKQVTAPFDGVITGRRIDIGDLVTAGSTQNTTSLYSLAQSDQIRVFVDVPQSAAVNLKEGAVAQTTSSDLPGKIFAGKIARTSNAIDPVSRTLHVEVDIPNPDMTLLPGMYVQVQFQVNRAGLLQVPASALLFRSTGPQVAVVDDQGKVNFRDVTIARDQGDVVELNSGLDANDRVALNISSQIIDGDKVVANEIEKAAQTPQPPSDVMIATSRPR
jgi:RND family efflux transporter MFP subunit